MTLKKRVTQLEREDEKSGYVKNVVILLTSDHGLNTPM